MPDAEARAGLSATARLALPIRVRSSQKAVAAEERRSATTEPIEGLGVMVTGPNSRPAWPAYSAYCWCLPPKKNRKM